MWRFAVTLECKLTDELKDRVDCERQTNCLKSTQVDVPLKEAHIKAERLGDDATFLLTMEVPIRSIQHTTQKNPIPYPFYLVCVPVNVCWFRSSESVSHKPKRLPIPKTLKPGSTLAKSSSDWPKTCFPNYRERVCISA